MTKMLASVTGPVEAEIALNGGADIIDLKNPSAGALGAVSIETIRETIRAIAGQRPVSAVCGDLPMQRDIIRAKVGETAATGVDYIKIGLFPADSIVDCLTDLKAVAGTAKLIAVFFADQKPDFSLLKDLADLGFHGAMVDTASKTGKRLLDHLPPAQIADFLEKTRSLGLLNGLAGSLEEPDVPRLLPYAPDFLGFRGALCDQSQRVRALDPAAVKQIRSLIPEEEPARRPNTVDYRLLAARGYSPDSGDASLKTNRIFVRDFILPVEIGAYSFEHGHTQKVKFDVTADVLRTVSNPEDMRHVFSYDVVMDGIRAIVARGHVQLAEALAEQVAAHVLSDPRVTRVTVRVEKLEIGPGGVGVEIERTRKEHVANVRDRQSRDAASNLADAVKSGTAKKGGAT